MCDLSQTRNKKSRRVSSRKERCEKRFAPCYSEVAAEGVEQPRKTRGKSGSKGKGEAKPEAVFSDGVANVPALANWLTDHLTDAQLAELLNLLHAGDAAAHVRIHDRDN